MNKSSTLLPVISELGYSKVVIEQAIARGDAGCRVVVYLKPTPEAQSSTGREYFQG